VAVYGGKVDKFKIQGYITKHSFFGCVEKDHTCKSLQRATDFEGHWRLQQIDAIRSAILLLVV